MEAPKNEVEKPADGIEEPPRPDAFLRFANWVSEAMGRPTNIIFWFVAVMAWTFIFAFGGPHLASGTWLPPWFTSTGFNFPLNLITTVAELFIGFLVAAAANRSQTALTALLGHIRAGVERDVQVESQIIDVENHLTELLNENTQLTRVVAGNTASIDELHAALKAICDHFGISSVAAAGGAQGLPAPPVPPPAPPAEPTSDGL
jgi:low affinity Fe/Cu permease